MRIVRRLQNRQLEDGFTLVELMVALLIFSIATVGIVPLLAASLHGSAIARSYTVNKNFAQEAMERLRGLPYYVSYASQNQRVDVLDLYFPNLGAGYASGTFTTTCTSATSGNPACPKNLPVGTSMTFKAAFVRTSTYSTLPASYSIVVPSAGYRWDSLASADIPPGQLLEVTVRTTWPMMAGDEQEITMKTLLADRKVGTTKVRGTARVDYAAQVLTGYEFSGQKSSLTFTGASSESKVETKLLSTANQNSTAGTLRLLRSSDDPTVLGTDIGTSPMSGASSGFVGPPDTTPAGATAGEQFLKHSDWIVSGAPRTVAWLDDSTTATLRAAVANELPVATGIARTPTNANTAAWVHNQADITSDSLFQVETGESMFEIAKTTRTMQAETSATTTAPTAADRKVETFADAKLGDVRVIPTKFVSGGDDHIIRISNFTARGTCRATASAATASATGSWTATLRYWRDPTQDGSSNGGYVTENLTSSTATAVMEGIQSTNPLVNDQPGTTDDVYLFRTATLQGYLTDWGATAPTATTSSDGRIANVNLDGAIRFDTSPSDPLVPDSVMSISLGKLSCEAVDNR